MITITPAAAERIRFSAAEGKMDGLSMRIAAKRNEDGSIHYGMGFDDNELDVVVAESSQALLEGTTLDFVELEPDNWQFIFMNPNDKNYSPPA